MCTTPNYLYTSTLVHKYTSKESTLQSRLVLPSSPDINLDMAGALVYKTLFKAREQSPLFLSNSNTGSRTNEAAEAQKCAQVQNWSRTRDLDLRCVVRKLSVLAAKTELAARFATSRDQFGGNLHRFISIFCLLGLQGIGTILIWPRLKTVLILDMLPFELEHY